MMCYYNTVFHAGHERFAASLAEAGIAAAIVPDLPLEESGRVVRGGRRGRHRDGHARRPDGVRRAARPVIERVARLRLLGRPARRHRRARPAGGQRDRRSPRGSKAITDKPVLVGVGVSNAEQAVEAHEVADGVIQGASVVRRMMEHGPDAVGDYVAEVRAALDKGLTPGSRIAGVRAADGSTPAGACGTARAFHRRVSRGPSPCHG